MPSARSSAQAEASSRPRLEPLLLTRKLGRGRMTYVDLALAPQWLNVHPGAYRLLANLISY
jgi:hypothetical protein